MELVRYGAIKLFKSLISVVKIILNLQMIPNFHEFFDYFRISV